MSTDDRRSPGATRIPFEGLVEVGGALGPSFEAQAVDVSEEGMHLRTAYLPEVGQPLSCRFDTASGHGVLATGEVIWKQEAGKGGEFGMKFTGLDAESVEALQSMVGPPASAHAAPAEGAPVPQQPGSRVRLHIEGLNSPMRAHVKNAKAGRVTTYSGLGFLQVGKQVELEDAATGAKRPARVVRVECEVDAESRVPQLVMSFAYADEQAAGDDDATPKEATPEPMVTHEEPAEEKSASADEIERASDQMKGFVARTATKVTPAIEKLMGRAKTTIGLLAQRGEKSDESAVPLRRRTSPPPQGGLHAAGRKVVRDSAPTAKEFVADVPTIKEFATKKRMMIASGAVSLAVIAAIAMHKPASATTPVATTETTPAAGAPATLTTAEAPLSAPPSMLQPVSPSAPSMNEATTNGATETMTNDVLDEPSHRHSASHVAPFSNGPVAHGNILRLKMDGPIEKIEGDAQATGFTVVLPGRKSIEPAAPLASHDGRIASIRVTNDNGGAELTLAFKDGVPNYLVRTRAKEADVLEIVLAPNGTHADRTDRPPVRPVSTGTRRHHRHH